MNRPEVFGLRNVLTVIGSSKAMWFKRFSDRTTGSGTNRFLVPESPLVDGPTCCSDRFDPVFKTLLYVVLNFIKVNHF